MLLNPISHLEIDSRITNITSERIGTDNASFIIHKLFLPNRISVELSIWIYGFVETLSRFINMFFSMNECFRSAWKHVCLLILCLRSQFSSCIRANNRFIVFVLITHSFTLEWVFLLDLLDPVFMIWFTMIFSFKKECTIWVLFQEVERKCDFLKCHQTQSIHWKILRTKIDFT